MSSGPGGKWPTAWVIRVICLAVAIVVVAATPAASAASAASSVTAEACFVSHPTQRPFWTVSGAWDGDDLLLVDAAANRVLRYSSQGRALGPIEAPGLRALGPFQPSTIASRDRSLVLKLTGGRMVFLGPDRSIRSRREIFRESAGSRGSIEAIHQWTLAGDDLVLCGDVKRSTAGRSGGAGGEAEWMRGFVRVPLGAPTGFETLRLFDSLRDPGQVFCRLGFPYIATIGDTAYFLVMDQAPAIYRTTPGGAVEPLAASDLPPRPQLPSLVSPQDFVTIYRMLEHETVPVGLLAWEERLFLLMREPTVTATRWMLYEIDPTDGSEIARAEIPSRANHLLAIPGDRQWVFVEKGPVLALGEQTVERFLHVDAASVRSIGSAKGLCPTAPSSIAP